MLQTSFDLNHLTTTSTQKSGNQLDFIYTRNCIADQFFIKCTLHFTTRVPPTPLPVTLRRNLHYLSPSHLSSVVYSSLPSPTNFSYLDVNAAIETLCSTLTSCLDDICPLSSRLARTAPSNPSLSDVLREPDLGTRLSPSIHSENTRMSCLQPGLIVSFTEQQTGC